MFSFLKNGLVKCNLGRVSESCEEDFQVAREIPIIP